MIIQFPLQLEIMIVLKEQKDVKNMVDMLNEFENPFMDHSKDLFALDTKVVVNEVVVRNLYYMVNVGIKQS